MQGFFRRILIVDLNRQKWYYESLNESILEKTMGGKGLGVYLLNNFQPPGISPLSSKNPLIFCLGPTTDTSVYGSSRYGVYTKSPLTNYFCESYSGGKAPERMSKTGIDALVILGKSKSLKYLLIKEERVEFIEAEILKGKDCHSTEIELKRIYGDRAGILCIGPAGENKIPFSIISNDLWRCAGRAGAGAVMGAKNLKAIVFLGGRNRQVAYEKELKEFSINILKEKANSPTACAYRELGTPMMVDIVNSVKAFPTKYWRYGYFQDHDKINASAMQKYMKVKQTACARCFMACGKLSEVLEGRHRGLKVEGPEYETIYAFGGLCMINDITEIAYLNDLCDKLGIDTITTGNLCAFAMELYEIGRIKENISYGDPDITAGLINDIVNKKGLGRILSKGIKKASEILNMQDIAIHVKGLEPAGYDPRYFKGMGISYAVSDRGACHLRTTFYKAELSGISKPNDLDDKIEKLIDFEDRLTLMDSLILCRFFRDFYLWEEMAEIIRLTTSFSYKEEELKRIAKDITDTARNYNIREGLTPEEDNLPQRFHIEPLPETEEVFNKRDFKKLLRQYYKFKQWKV
ncbi:MAG: aldehyde ferredoxin oxidoreductase family protein [Thermodesulfovibrio sp.]|nr:aldehyde ferredoxin oxidoreductase family protein [Thermodesulfovibrio sp.]